jgi:hypothetical protein
MVPGTGHFCIETQRIKLVGSGIVIFVSGENATTVGTTSVVRLNKKMSALSLSVP